MLKFVVTRKSNRKVLLKRQFLKALTPVKKENGRISPEILQSPNTVYVSRPYSTKKRRAPPPPTRTTADVIKEQGNATTPCQKLLQSVRSSSLIVAAISDSVISNSTQFHALSDSAKSVTDNTVPVSTATGNHGERSSHEISKHRDVVCQNANIPDTNKSTLRRDVSFELKLVDNQLNNIQSKTRKLRERDAEIRRRFDAVRRKATHLIYRDEDDKGRTNETFLFDEGDSASPTRQLQGSHQFQDQSKPSVTEVDITYPGYSVFDNGLYVPKTTDRLNSIVTGRSPVPASIFRKLRRSSSSPKRLHHIRSARALPKLTSPMTRGLKEKVNSTRDVIMRALKKDTRKFTFC